MRSDPSSSADASYLLDSESAAEMTRLIGLDQFTTKAMGGPLVEQPDPSTFQNVLDIACGPGGWVLDVAFAYPHVEVAGIDISQIMIRYANTRAHSQRKSNASFGVMDIREPLDFSDYTFNLVNARLLTAALPRKLWPQLLKECVRIVKSGGVIRLTECDQVGLTNSPAFERLSEIVTHAAHRLGYGFSPDGRSLGTTPVLEHLLHEAGCQDIQSKGYAINFSVGTQAWTDFYHNYDILFKGAQPLCVKAGIASQEELDRLHEQMLSEMQMETFCGMWFFATSWGICYK